MVARARTSPAHQPRWERQGLSDSVTLSEVIDAGLRFEASTFNIAARNVRDKLARCGYALQPLSGSGGLASEAHNAFRFRRIFVTENHGVPFLPSSEINSVRPRVERWISRKLTQRLDYLLIQRNDVLISRSGSIGNIGFAGRRMAGMALSEDAIRVRFADEEVAGYVAAFLRTAFGRLQLQSVTYGSVIVHIEPEHLARVSVPDLGASVRSKIGRTMIVATEKRDEANDLIDTAISKMDMATGIRPFSSIEREAGRLSNCVRLRELGGRFEGAFHDPVARAVKSSLDESAVDVVPLCDSGFIELIKPITKFRKRTYVETGGIPLLSSKQLFQIDPIDIKALAKGAHVKDLTEIALEPYMLIVTCSGTIGRIQIIPEYMRGWAANQHATRLVPVDRLRGAYLFAWLSSFYGQRLIHRHSYGSVVQEIDKNMIGAVPVPVVSGDAEREIAGPVLQANRLRDEAWTAEHDVIQDLVGRIERRLTSKSAFGAGG